MTAQLTLRPVGRDDYASVSGIDVAPEHQKFSGTVRDAFEADEDGVDFHAILLEDTAIGFFKVDRAYSKTITLASADELGLRAFIVDRAHHGRGIATSAVRALSAYLPQRYPNATAITLTVNMSNPAAIRCYLKGGFVDTGETWLEGEAGPQYFMRMPLRAD